MSSNVNGRYGLLTAASMVIGIVIGSGIFFKADDILGMTGSVGLGVLGFLLIGVGVICGAVIVSQYAVNNPRSGGLVAYAEEAFGPKFALITAWLLQSVYFPAFVAILARVTAIYTVILFGWSESLVLPISLFYLVGCFITNYKSPELGGKLQVTTTISKLIPLIVIGIVGVFFNFNAETVTTSYVGPNETNFFGALIAIAFAFDGWIVATSISGEIKNMKRNLPLALIMGSVMIMVIYIVYFTGISLIAGPDQVIAGGDAHVALAANKLLGPIGEKVITLFVVISAFGGTNGMTLAYLRMPKVLTENKLFNDKLSFANVDERTGISVKGALVCGLFLAFYVVLDNLSISAMFESIKFDISALPMIPVYIVYATLYVGVIKLLRKNNASPLYYVALVVAVLVALIVLIGSIPNNGLLYLVTTAIMYVFLVPFLQKK